MYGVLFICNVFILIKRHFSLVLVYIFVQVSVKYWTDKYRNSLLFIFLSLDILLFLYSFLEIFNRFYVGSFFMLISNVCTKLISWKRWEGYFIQCMNIYSFRVRNEELAIWRNIYRYMPRTISFSYTRKIKLLECTSYEKKKKKFQLWIKKTKEMRDIKMFTQYHWLQDVFLFYLFIYLFLCCCLIIKIVRIQIIAVCFRTHTRHWFGKYVSSFLYAIKIELCNYIHIIPSITKLQ